VAIGDRSPLRDQVDLLDLLGRGEAPEGSALERDQVQLTQRGEREQGKEAREQQADPPFDETRGADLPCRPRSAQGTVAPVLGCCEAGCVPVEPVPPVADGVCVLGGDVPVEDVPVAPAAPVVPVAGGVTAVVGPVEETSGAVIGGESEAALTMSLFDSGAVNLSRPAALGASRPGSAVT
jgi:hypothetical protein